MAETEGTIQFAYDLQPPDAEVADAAALARLGGWRAVFKRLAVLGQDPERYGGLGFGNLSCRDAARPGEFVVTASQTAAAPTLTDDDLVRITHNNPARFWVDAVGRQPPSSETLTHAMIYQADPDIAWVFHLHCPDIWLNSEQLGLPVTDEHVTYGSPAMIDAVARLLNDQRQRPLVFATLGHRDGVFACGASADAAGGAVVALLARVLA